MGWYYVQTERITSYYANSYQIDSAPTNTVQKRSCRLPWLVYVGKNYKKPFQAYHKFGLEFCWSPLHSVQPKSELKSTWHWEMWRLHDASSKAFAVVMFPHEINKLIMFIWYVNVVFWKWASSQRIRVHGWGFFKFHKDKPSILTHFPKKKTEDCKYVSEKSSNDCRMSFSSFEVLLPKNIDSILVSHMTLCISSPSDYS